jgi:hypothetical protein
MAFTQSHVDAFAASDAPRYFAHFHPEATFFFYDTPGRMDVRARTPVGQPRGLTSRP